MNINDDAGNVKPLREPQPDPKDPWERINDKLAKSEANFLRACGYLSIAFGRNMFTGQAMVAGLTYTGPLFDDAAHGELKLLLREQFKLHLSDADIWAMVELEARRNAFHPVHEYLDALVWDGVPRIDDWLIDYCAAEPSEYVKRVSSIFLIAAVRRVRRPGCKFDMFVVLEGPQGCGKSSAIAALAGEWFSDYLPLGKEQKEAIEHLSGHWIIEHGELAGLGSREVESVKAFITRQTDSARLSYDRKSTKAPRQCVFIGTTNKTEYLSDRTGNRRFHGIRVGNVHVRHLAEDRDQLWAEAAHREALGEPIYLPYELEAVARAEQAKRVQADPWHDMLEDALQDHTGKILCENIAHVIGMQSERQNAYERLGMVMRNLGWERKKRRMKGKLRWCYVKGHGCTPLELRKSGDHWEVNEGMPNLDE